MWTEIRISDVFRVRLGVLDEHVEIAVVVEDARVQKFVLELFARAAPVRFDQVAIGILPLRVLVQILHVRVRRRAVEIKVVFLDVLAVVAFAVGQAEQAFLQDRVAAIPQRQRKAEPLLVVGDAGQAIFTPAIGAGARLVVSEVVPGVAIVRCSPRAPCPTDAR